MSIEYESKLHDSFGFFLKEADKYAPPNLVTLEKKDPSYSIEADSPEISKILIALLDGPKNVYELSKTLGIGVFRLAKSLSKLSETQVIKIDQKSDLVGLTEVGQMIAKVHSQL